MTGTDSRPTTYKDAGVDIEAGNRLVGTLARLARSTSRPEVVAGVGGFAGLAALPAGYDEPLLVASTDGVGTKLLVAIAAGRHDTVGVDLVAMGVNDLLAVGAEPLLFLDYVATGRLEPEVVEGVVRGVAEGCRQAGCALLGGETAEMPGMYPAGAYDLAGFAVGVVERRKVIDGSRAEPGDVVIGLPSTGLHSNGYSLARRVLLPAQSEPHASGEAGPLGEALAQPVPELGRSLADELLEPTRIYVTPVRALMSSTDVRALCHVTGGGLVDNPPRSVPEGLGFRLDTTRWQVPPVMTLIAERGRVPAGEMWRTFNMGLGFLAVVPAAEAANAETVVGAVGGRVVGEVVARQAGAPAVELEP